VTWQDVNERMSIDDIADYNDALDATAEATKRLMDRAQKSRG
jgi:hypothetical protein